MILRQRYASFDRLKRKPGEAIELTGEAESSHSASAPESMTDETAKSRVHLAATDVDHELGVLRLKLVVRIE